MMEKEIQDKFSIHMGAIADPLTVQLEAQGLKYDSEKVKHFEKLLSSIIHLKFANILPESSVEKCRQKLFKQIVAHVQKHNSE